MDNTGRYAGLVPDFEPREAPQTTTGSKSDLIDGLACCPCGQQPEKLIIDESGSCKYFLVYGDCCNEWIVEFRTNYRNSDTDECMQLAIAAWNSAPRAS